MKMLAIFTLPLYEFLYHNEEKIIKFLESKKASKQLLIVDEAQISPEKLQSELLREKKVRDSSKNKSQHSPPHAMKGLPTGHSKQQNPIHGMKQGSFQDPFVLNIVDSAAQSISNTSRNVSQVIPTFFNSKKTSYVDEIHASAIETVLQKVGEITISNIQALLDVLKFPFYMKNTLWNNLLSFVREHIDIQSGPILRLKPSWVQQYFNQLLRGKDKLDRYFIAIKQDFKRNHLIPADFENLVKDIIDLHPGLTFLNEHESYKHFHTYYAKCVIVRIFYNIATGGADIIDQREFRKSNFVCQLESLKTTDNINNELHYFSYEHFYVLFCKLWDLDIEHSYTLTRDRLLQYSDYALTEKIINRVFDGYGRKIKCPVKGRIGYEDFIWFVLCEEDKSTSQSLGYWFRCVDIDGDGFITAYEMEYFFKEQLERMRLVQQEVVSFEDVYSQIIDMLKPKNPECITLSDIKRSKMGHVFFNILFNLNKYLLFESKALVASNWNEWASIQYEQMAMEEG